MKPTKLVWLLAIAAVVLAVSLCAFAFAPADLATLLSFAALGMGFAVRDAALLVTRALPNGAATTTSAAIDLGHGSFGDFVADAEILVTAPALTTGELADTQTITYHVIHSHNADLSSPATLCASVITQTGAGGAGAAGATFQGRLPVDVRRYIGLQQVKTGASNASTSSGKLEVLT